MHILTSISGYRIDSKYLKHVILDQSNKAKIRPILLSFDGIPESGKTKAVLIF